MKFFGEKRTTWTDSTLRSWLNNDFIKDAFTTVEASYISTESYGINLCGENVPNDVSVLPSTNDKIVIPSFTELVSKNYGFNDTYGNVSSRTAAATAYAANKQSTIETGYTVGYWLRDAQGKNTDSIEKTILVGSQGDLDFMGADNTHVYGVRPMMTLETSTMFSDRKSVV